MIKLDAAQQKNNPIAKWVNRAVLFGGALAAISMVGCLGAHFDPNSFFTAHGIIPIISDVSMGLGALCLFPKVLETAAKIAILVGYAVVSNRIQRQVSESSLSSSQNTPTDTSQEFPPSPKSQKSIEQDAVRVQAVEIERIKQQLQGVVEETKQRLKKAFDQATVQAQVEECADAARAICPEKILGEILQSALNQLQSAMEARLQDLLQKERMNLSAPVIPTTQPVKGQIHFVGSVLGSALRILIFG